MQLAERSRNNFRRKDKNRYLFIDILFDLSYLVHQLQEMLSPPSPNATYIEKRSINVREKWKLLNGLCWTTLKKYPRVLYHWYLFATTKASEMFSVPVQQVENHLREELEQSEQGLSRANANLALLQKERGTQLLHPTLTYSRDVDGIGPADQLQCEMGRYQERCIELQEKYNKAEISIEEAQSIIVQQKDKELELVKKGEEYMHKCFNLEFEIERIKETCVSLSSPFHCSVDLT